MVRIRKAFNSEASEGSLLAGAAAFSAAIDRLGIPQESAEEVLHWAVSAGLLDASNITFNDFMNLLLAEISDDSTRCLWRPGT